MTPSKHNFTFWFQVSFVNENNFISVNYFSLKSIMSFNLIKHTHTQKKSVKV